MQQPGGLCELFYCPGKRALQRDTTEVTQTETSMGENHAFN